MAQLLVRVHDKLDVAHSKADRVCGRGDVVAAVDDAHEFSRIEKTAPFWRILKVPGMGKVEAQLLTQPRLMIGQFGVQVVGRRLKTLDIASLPRSFIDDDSRTSPWMTVTAETIRSCTQEKLDRSRIAPSG